MTSVGITCSLVANGGDAAILVGTLRVLEEAFGEINPTVYDLLPEVARRHYPELNVQPAPFRFALRPPPHRLGRVRNRVTRQLAQHQWRAACRAIRAKRFRRADTLVGADAAEMIQSYANLDLTVASGGTYLVENYDMTKHLVDLELAPLVGVPQALLTQSLGPFTVSANQRAIRKLVARTDLTLLRDTRSRDHLRDIGADGPNVHVGADTAFALVDPNVLRDARSRSWPTDRSPRVGISVRRWSYFRTLSTKQGMAQYETAVRTLVEHLVRERGAEVTFVSSCQGNPEYGSDDSQLAAEWVSRFPNDIRDSVEVNVDYHRPETLMNILGSFDLVVSTRMHVAILALCAGTPVLPISYEFKTDELFKNLSAPEWVCDIETLSELSLVSRVNRVLHDLPKRRQALLSAVQEMHESAMNAACLLRDKFPQLRDEYRPA